MITTYNPEIYLESAIRVLKEYVNEGFNQAVVGTSSADVGLQVYEVVMEFPSDEKILTYIPGKKSIIHFELDDIEDHSLGFGRNVAKTVHDPILGTVTEQEGRRHILNFDVGIWTWDKSGGTTARLRARQILTNLFTGAMATENLRAFSDGGDGKLEILGYSGGHFMVEYVNDMRVFRQINSTLNIRVFSRTPTPFVIPSIEQIDIDSQLVIEGEILSD
jgi:hypothetical protein